MKSVYKRIVCVLLAVIMLPLCLWEVAVPAQAAYENTYKNTGDMRADIIGVALTQVGYSEASDGSTKYGQWYGHPTVAWCGVFVAWCANQAGIPTSIIKKQGFASASAFGLKTFTASERTPQPGDLYFRGTSHVGIVYYVEGNYFYTLEGNTWDSNPTHRVMSKKKDLYSSSFVFASPAYEGGSGCVHNYQTYCEETHPHKEYKKCTKCGDQQNMDTNAVLDSCLECRKASCTHTYGSWINLDDIYHHRVCSWCQTIEVENHNWKLLKAIKDSDGAEFRTYQCSDCGQAKTEGDGKLPGDFNRDGIVDEKDVEQLLWTILFPESYQIEGEADFTADGIVDEKDVELLLWHTLFPDEYPLK